MWIVYDEDWDYVGGEILDLEGGDGFLLQGWILIIVLCDFRIYIKNSRLDGNCMEVKFKSVLINQREVLYKKE